MHDLRQPITSTESVLQAHWLTDADEINKLRVHIVLFAEKRWPCAQERWMKLLCADRRCLVCDLCVEVRTKKRAS